MPMIRARYPDDWDDISRRIREQAGNRCQFCGVPNGVTIARHQDDPSQYTIINNDGTFTDSAGNPVQWVRVIDLAKRIRVVLTVAHLDHDPSHNDDANLRALCQRCHLVYDKDHHAKNARVTRALKREQNLRDAGQTLLFEITEDAAP